MWGGRVAELKETRKEGKGSKTSIKDLIKKKLRMEIKYCSVNPFSSCAFQNPMFVP